MNSRVIVRLTNEEYEMLQKYAELEHREAGEQAGYLIGRVLRAKLASKAAANLAAANLAAADAAAVTEGQLS